SYRSGGVGRMCASRSSRFAGPRPMTPSLASGAPKKSARKRRHNDEWYDASDADNRRAEAIGAMENILDGLISTLRDQAKKGTIDKVTAHGLRVSLEGDLAARGYAFRDLGKARFPTHDGQGCFEFAPPPLSEPET
ncbi:MAG: hypothetical protein ACRC7C_14345, partial [Beijerinckiaceae bacterium]